MVEHGQVATQSRRRAVVILPTYNEADNIETCIHAIFREQPNVGSHELHVLVVDDNSPDGTAQLVLRKQAGADVPGDIEPDKYLNHLHLISGDKRGLGEAYKRGMTHALRHLDPDLIFQMDADGQHDSTLIPLFINLTQHGFTLVIGSRFALGGATPDFSLWRRILSRTGNFLVRYFGGIARIHDSTSGYRCIKADLVPRCNLEFLSTRGYSFQSSLLCELVRTGARVIEVPIIFPDRKQGESKLSIRDQLEFLLNIGKIRFRNSEEFIKYCCVGASGVVINLGLYVLLTRAGGLVPDLASPIAIELSILSNFVLNHQWTFRVRNAMGSLRRKFVKFHMAAGVSGVMNYLVFLALFRLVGINDILANLCGIAVATLLNYSINSFWTWKRTDTPSAASGEDPLSQSSRPTTVTRHPS